MSSSVYFTPSEIGLSQSDDSLLTSAGDKLLLSQFEDRSVGIYIEDGSDVVRSARLIAQRRAHRIASAPYFSLVLVRGLHYQENATAPGGKIVLRLKGSSRHRIRLKEQTR